MICYKIIQNEQVIDAGFVFLKWNETRHKMNLCNENEAQFVQSFDQTKVYRDEWLKPFTGEIDFEPAKVEIIPQIEFEEIRALLDGDEIIPVLPEPVEEEVVPEVEEQKVETSPLSISEMRQMIIEQKEQIAELSTRIQEMNAALNK